MNVRIETIRSSPCENFLLFSREYFGREKYLFIEIKKLGSCKLKALESAPREIARTEQLSLPAVFNYREEQKLHPKKEDL